MTALAEFESNPMVSRGVEDDELGVRIFRTGTSGASVTELNFSAKFEEVALVEEPSRPFLHSNQ